MQFCVFVFFYVNKRTRQDKEIRRPKGFYCPGPYGRSPPQRNYAKHICVNFPRTAIARVQDELGPKRKHFQNAPGKISSEQLRKVESVELFGHSEVQKNMFFRQSLLILPVLQKMTHMRILILQGLDKLLQFISTFLWWLRLDALLKGSRKKLFLEMIPK